MKITVALWIPCLTTSSLTLEFFNVSSNFHESPAKHSEPGLEDSLCTKCVFLSVFAEDELDFMYDQRNFGGNM